MEGVGDRLTPALGARGGRGCCGGCRGVYGRIPVRACRRAASRPAHHRQLRRVRRFPPPAAGSAPTTPPAASQRPTASRPSWAGGWRSATAATAGLPPARRRRRSADAALTNPRVVVMCSFGQPSTLPLQDGRLVGQGGPLDDLLRHGHRPDHERRVRHLLEGRRQPPERARRARHRPPLAGAGRQAQPLLGGLAGGSRERRRAGLHQRLAARPLRLCGGRRHHRSGGPLRLRLLCPAAAHGGHLAGLLPGRRRGRLRGLRSLPRHAGRFGDEPGQGLGHARVRDAHRKPYMVSESGFVQGPAIKAGEHLVRQGRVGDREQPDPEHLPVGDAQPHGWSPICPGTTSAPTATPSSTPAPSHSPSTRNGQTTPTTGSCSPSPSGATRRRARRAARGRARPPRSCRRARRGRRRRPLPRRPRGRSRLRGAAWPRRRPGRRGG